MNMRNEWTVSESESFSDVFYNKKESIQNVKDNFDLRRYYTAEGYDIEINGVTERCLVQTSSNPLRDLNDYRKIHCPITADVKRGYYVKFEDSVWIIDTNVVDVDGAYLSTRMSRCQFLLRWQDKSGRIIEKWSYSSDQTKYSNGETGNSVVVIGDNQYCLLLPIDEDTKALKRGMRFAVDFDDADEPDIYKLSNRKVNLNNELYYDRGGTMFISLSYDEFNPGEDKYVTLDNGKQVWICNYKEPDNTEKIQNDSLLKADIIGNKNLKVGFSRIYVADIIMNNGKQADWNTTGFYWNVVSDFDIDQALDGNKINLLVNDEDLINSSFLLQVIYKGEVVSEIVITVVETL